MLEECAKKGKYVELPYTVKGMNMLFTGSRQLLRKARTASKEDVT